MGWIKDIARMKTAGPGAHWSLESALEETYFPTFPDQALVTNICWYIQSSLHLSENWGHTAGSKASGGFVDLEL